MSKEDLVVVASNTHMRKPSLEDAEAIFALVDKNRDMGKYLDWVPLMITVEDEYKFLESVLNQKKIEMILYVVVVDNKIAGLVDCHTIEAEQEYGEIGYWLASEFRGQGVARKCVEVLGELMFNNHGLKTLVIRAHRYNHASQKLALACGYVPSGHEGSGKIFSLRR